MTAGKSSSAVERICRAIEDAIRKGELVAGQRLIEAELTRKLNVSRGPLREAMRDLEAEGLIALHPNRGASVRKLTRRDLAESFELRGVLEGTAAARCAKRIGEVGVREQIAAFFHEAQAYLDGEQRRPFVEHDTAMHEAILKLCENRILEEYCHRLRTPFFRLRFFTSSAVLDVKRSATEHVELLGAILDGDNMAAEQIARAHVSRIHGVVQRMTESDFDQTFHFGRPNAS